MKEQTKFPCEICDKRFNLTSLDLKRRLECLSKILSFVWKSKQVFVVRYVKKDSISHCDLKTRLEFFLKIHSFVWKSTQDCIVRYVTEDLKDLNSYQKFIALNERANKTPLWDIWKKIQFDI